MFNIYAAATIFFFLTLIIYPDVCHSTLPICTYLPQLPRTSLCTSTWYWYSLYIDSFLCISFQYHCIIILIQLRIVGKGLLSKHFTVKSTTVEFGACDTFDLIGNGMLASIRDSRVTLFLVLYCHLEDVTAK